MDMSPGQSDRASQSGSPEPAPRKRQRLPLPSDFDFGPEVFGESGASSSRVPATGGGSLGTASLAVAADPHTPIVLSDNELRLMSCCICLNVVPARDLFLHARPDDTQSERSMCVAITCTDCSFRMWWDKTNGKKKFALIDCSICKELLYYDESGRTDRCYQKLFASSIMERNPSITCSGCDCSVPYADYDGHLHACEAATSVCPFRCGKKYKFGKLRAHFPRCTERIRYKCPRCPEMISEIRMEEHMKNEHDHVWPDVIKTSEHTTIQLHQQYYPSNDDINIVYELEGVRLMVSVWCDDEIIKAVVACIGGYPSDPQTYQVKAGIRYTVDTGTTVNFGHFGVTSGLTTCRVTDADERYLTLSGRSPRHRLQSSSYDINLSVKRIGAAEGP